MVEEKDLDRAFAEMISESPDFLGWVLRKTKFSDIADRLVLMVREQADLKPRKKPENWWRHWWCRLEDGSESETDIFIVLRDTDSGDRVALHIEDKPPHGKFTPDQYINYKKRADFMANKDTFMNYREYTTILLAPNSFISTNQDKVKHFDCQITYESVSKYIPLFKQSLQECSGA